MKTSPLKRGALALLAAAGLNTGAVEMSRFECLRAFIPIADRGSFQVHRKGFESPFLLRDKYIIFPEVAKNNVTGFYVYQDDKAWYYDGVEIQGQRSAIADLKPDNSLGVLELTAQPNGLETISLMYLPAYNPHGTDKHGPVMLGSSVLPVIGAFVSRPTQRQITYYDPSQSSKEELKAWMSENTSSRGPAASAKEEVKHTIVKMVTLHEKSGAALSAPMIEELKIRREWVQSHNLDEATFKKLAPVIERCHD